MSREVYLTTTDNPYHPGDQFAEWYNFDIQHGYDSMGYLDRVLNTTDSLGPHILDEDVERAIDDIVRYNLSGVHTKMIVENNKPPLYI